MMPSVGSTTVVYLPENCCKNKKAVSRSVADIVYDRATGDLYYNANEGLPGFGGGGKIATLEDAPEINPSDFILTE